MPFSRSPRRFVAAACVGAAALLPGPAASQPAGGKCVVVPAAVVHLSSVAGGALREMSVRRGDPVGSGDVVARLDDRREELGFMLARARLDSRRAAGMPGPDLAVAEIELQMADLALSERRIVSPIDGVVVAWHAAVGEVLPPHGMILTVAQLDALAVEVRLPAAALGTVSAGDRGRVLLHAQGVREVEAAVTVVDPMLDPATGTFGVRLALPNADLAVAAGQTCDVAFRPG